MGKKVLIVSMTCGEGHNSVSKTIKERLEELDMQVKIIELFGYNPKRVKFENWQYLFACKYARVPFSIGWEHSVKANPEKRDKLGVHNTIKKSLGYLKEQIDDFAPDAILTTHPYSNVAVNDMIKKDMISKNIKTVSVLTDYCVHPYWEAGIELDYVIAPTDEVFEDLKYRGYKEEQIKIIGYPVAPKFSKEISKQEAREQLGIEDKFTVMLLSGGNGLGNSKKLIKTLLKSEKEFQILCICGKNAKAKKQLDDFVEKNDIKNVKVYGFVNNIEVLMSASNCMFSRGGGVSITEALNINVPLIIREKMIINEKRNKDFLLKRKSAIEIESISEAKDAVEYLIDNPEKVEEIIENQKLNVNKNASIDIAKFIEEIIS